MTQKANQPPSNQLAVSQQYRPGDDFYNYVCHQWLLDNPKPVGLGCVNQASLLTDRVRLELQEIIRFWQANRTTLAAGPRQALDFYQSYLKKDRYQAASGRSLISQIKELVFGLNPANLAARLGRSQRLGLAWFWDFQIGVDQTNNRRHCLILVPADLTLGPAHHYLDSNWRSVRSYYQAFIKSYWQAAERVCRQVSTESLSRYRHYYSEVIWTLESQLARWRLLTVNDRISLDYGSLKARYKFDWDSYFAGLGLDRPPAQLSVTGADYFNHLSQYLSGLDPNRLQIYCFWRLLSTWAGYVDDRLARAQIDLQQKTGRPRSLIAPADLKARALWLTNQTWPDVFGAEYVRRHFRPALAAEVDRLAELVRAGFIRRLKHNPWLGNSRLAAINKIKAVQINIGRPRTWAEVVNLKLPRTNPLQAVLNLAEHNSHQALARLRRRPNRTNFGHDGYYGAQSVTAWSDPLLLTTNLPAGLCQWPFFDPEADLTANLSRLGLIIGHELSHHLDPRGLVYGQFGRLDWLDDGARHQLGASLKPLLASLPKSIATASSGQFNNPAVNEILADQAGLLVVIDIIKNRLRNPDRQRLALEQLLISYAYLLAENASYKYLANKLSLSGHPANRLRVNSLLGHLDCFYQVYPVGRKSRLYLAPKRRVVLW